MMSTQTLTSITMQFAAPHRDKPTVTVTTTLSDGTTVTLPNASVGNSALTSAGAERLTEALMRTLLNELNR
jgi:hypothetical protein